MNYQETIDYLYQLLPVFHREGKKAYKANLDNTLKIASHLDNPHLKFKSIHVAGTNGKGSTSHFLASILQSAGYKTALYTSPHLKSFTERIKINGQAIPEKEIIDFVSRNQSFINELRPSFFELTVGLAFEYFASQKVDIAIIEVGLGGLLDSTNIIQPVLSVITNIGYDHTDILGETLGEIAFQKAGIIKENTPVVISERHVETEKIFEEIAKKNQSNVYFAQDYYQISNSKQEQNELIVNTIDLANNIEKQFKSGLTGSYQLKNILGVLKSIEILNQNGFSVSEQALKDGINNVIANTQLKGRWQQLHFSPTIICDTAHNKNGFDEIVKMIENQKYNQLWFILGFMEDKDVNSILEMLPKNANYIFCKPNNPRAKTTENLIEIAKAKQLKSSIIENVNDAINYVQKNAHKDDFIYVGGSTFVVADINNL
ncbi:MAG: bifunctional folylpolyglutamate synthase/dihydrofolate synthase [Pseudarcicella sp.]|nr:bifunctional folylpolyglutamate synthase/dihydrofolate synthase [Pseudarcicella sp.]